MKAIDKDELYQHLCDFLKAKGVDLRDGSYPQRIRQGCNLLAGAINATQKTAKQAKVKVEKKLDKLRHCIHQATAPNTPASQPGTEPRAASDATASRPKNVRPKGRRQTQPKARRRK